MSRFGLILVGLLLSPCALAQVCNVQMSYWECHTALNAALDEDAVIVTEAAIKTTEGAKADLNNINTGSQSGSDTATEDFNPRLQASVDTLGLTGDNAAGVTLAWNDLFEGLIKNRFFGDDGSGQASGQHHKLIVKLEEAILFDPLKQAISDESVADDLSSSFSDFDDVSLDLRISLNSAKYGRDVNNNIGYVDAIQQESMLALTDKIATMGELTFAVDKILQENISDKDALDKKLIDVMDAEKAIKLIRKIEAARGAHLDYGAAYEKVARANGLFRLMELVNNQPQLVLSVKARIRDDLVGPNEISANFSYEFGGVNLNTYGRYRRHQCGADKLDIIDKEVECLVKFIGNNDRAITGGSRFAVSLEYLRKEDYSFNDLGVMLNLDSESSLIGKLTYGRYVNFGLNEVSLKGRSRIDFSASYEDVSNDPIRNDRTIVNGTFAQEISDGWFLTLGFAWANKPEYLGQAENELSAMAGFSYKLARQQ